MQGNPARVAAHHFKDHDALVRFRRGVKSIESVGGNVQCGNEAKRKFRTRQIVINRFGHTDDRHPTLVKLHRNSQRAFTAEYYKAFDSQTIYVIDGLAVDGFGLDLNSLTRDLDKTSSIARAQDCAATWQQSADIGGSKFSGLRFAQESLKPVLNPDYFHSILSGCSSYHRTNNSV